MVELLKLSPNILQEGVAQPAADHHDEEDWAATYGQAQANQVGPYYLLGNVEHIFLNWHNCIPHHIGELSWSDVVDLIMPPQG